MILTGTNYNIRDNTIEHQRLMGKGVYNESRAEHFLNLHNRKPVVYKGAGLFGQTSNRGRGDANKILSLMTPMKKGGSFISPQKKNTMKDIMKGVKPFVGGSLKRSEQQQEEMNLRVNAEKPRKRTGENPTDKNVKRAVSGRSTQGINRNKKADYKESFAIMRANTKRQMEDTQQPIKGGFVWRYIDI
jgi:hypothetical protein